MSYQRPDPEPPVKILNCPVCDLPEDCLGDICECSQSIKDMDIQLRMYRARYIKLKNLNTVQRAELWSKASMKSDPSKEFDEIIDRMPMPKR